MSARAQLVAACRRLAESGLSPGSTGNVSMLDEDGTILVTPSGTALARIVDDALLRVSFDGTVLEGSLRPSKETGAHLAIYRSARDAHAVVHLHAVSSTAASIVVGAGATLPRTTVYQQPRLGTVTVLAEAPPGSAGLAEAIGETARTHRAFLLAAHGSVTVGTTLEHAVDLAEELDATCATYLAVRQATGS